MEQNYLKKLTINFWSKVDVREPDDCWIFKHQNKKYPYAKFRFFGKQVGAHRVAYMLCKGPIENGYEIMHSCHNTRCVNPRHLIAGTHQDNIYNNRFKNLLEADNLLKKSDDHIHEKQNIQDSDGT